MSIVVTGANRHGVMQPELVLDEIAFDAPVNEMVTPVRSAMVERMPEIGSARFR